MMLSPLVMYITGLGRWRWWWSYKVETYLSICV